MTAAPEAQTPVHVAEVAVHVERAPMAWLQSCMGGWCERTNKCPNFKALSPRQQPVERLCIKGQDGVSGILPVGAPR